MSLFIQLRVWWHMLNKPVDRADPLYEQWIERSPPTREQLMQIKREQAKQWLAEHARTQPN